MQALKVRLFALAVLTVLFQACGSPKQGPAPQAQNPERPAPGTMTALPAEKVDLEGKWTWSEFWSSIGKNNRCAITPVGMKEAGPEGAVGQYKVNDLDNSLVLSLTVNLEVGTFGGVRVMAPKSKAAGVWYARQSDVTAHAAFPFKRTQYALLKETSAGLFESELAAPAPTGDPTDNIALLRIDLYGSPGDTVELQSVKVRVPRKTAWQEAKPVPVELAPTDADLATALLARATATGAMDDWDAAATKLADAGLFSEAEGKAVVENAQAVAAEALNAGKAKEALQAFSVAAKMSGRPWDFLLELVTSTGEQHRAMLWPAEPYLIMDAMAYPRKEPFYAWRDSGKRTVQANELVKDSAPNGGWSGHLSVTAPTAKESSWYTFPTSVPVTEKPVYMRFWFRELNPSQTKGIVMADMSDKKSALVVDNLDPEKAKDDWQYFRARKPIAIGTATYDGKTLDKGSIIRLIGINVEGGANEFWIGPAEIYIPAEEGK